MAVDSNPSFSILLEQGFMDKIGMPSAFVKEHKKMLAKTAILKTDEGMIWEAKIVRKASDYFIGEGDWPRFVLRHKLEVGDMLIFFLINKSTFQVLLYSKKCLTNIPHFEELSSSEDEVENIEASTGSRKRVDPPGISSEANMETIILSDSEKERVDPSKDGGNPDTMKTNDNLKKMNAHMAVKSKRLYYYLKKMNAINKRVADEEETYKSLLDVDQEDRDD